MAGDTPWTPGPWEAERAVNMAGFETGKVWIVMRGEPKAYDFDRFEDAQLAAAAPEMAEALGDCLHELDAFARCMVGGADPDEVQAKIDKARTLLAKIGAAA